MKLFQPTVPGITNLTVSVLALVVVVGVLSGGTALVVAGTLCLLACWRPMIATVLMFSFAAMMAALFAEALSTGICAWLLGLFVVGVSVYLGLLFLRVAYAARSIG